MEYVAEVRKNSCIDLDGIWEWGQICVGHRNHVLLPDAYWRHLANMIEHSAVPGIRPQCMQVKECMQV